LDLTDSTSAVIDRIWQGTKHHIYGGTFLADTASYMYDWRGGTARFLDAIHATNGVEGGASSLSNNSATPTLTLSNTATNEGALRVTNGTSNFWTCKF